MWLPEAEGERRGNWMKIVKMYKLLVINTNDVMHNMINTTTTAVGYMGQLRE